MRLLREKQTISPRYRGIGGKMKDLRRFSGAVVRPGSEEEFDGKEKHCVVALLNRLAIGDALVINRIDDANPDAI
jgi:hypothetical protein